MITVQAKARPCSNWETENLSVLCSGLIAGYKDSSGLLDSVLTVMASDSSLFSPRCYLHSDSAGLSVFASAALGCALLMEGRVTVPGGVS